MAFALGQPAVQVLNVLTGFLLLRWLTIEQYAQFGLAFAFQSVVSQFADLGFSSSILGLAGEKGTDSHTMGRFIRSAKHFRFRMASIVIVASIFAFPAITANQPWPTSAKAALLLSTIAAVIFQGRVMYNAPLLAHRRVASLYVPQLLGAASRLSLSSLFYGLGLLNGWLASCFGAVAIGVNGMFSKRYARDLIVEPTQSDSESNREMLRFIRPLIPAVVFATLQSQITVGIITLFGATREIAQVAALGRVGQLFMILSSFNSVIIAPYIASVPPCVFRRRYSQIIFVGSLLTVGMAACGFLFPRPILWLLGPKYHELGPEVGWVVLTGCLTYLTGVFWTMHAARKWVFWQGTTAHIAGVLICQVAACFTLNLSTTLGVILFGVVTAAAILLVQIGIGLVAFGFLKNS